VAAVKPEVHVSQLVDMIESKIPKAYTMFFGLAKSMA